MRYGSFNNGPKRMTFRIMGAKDDLSLCQIDAVTFVEICFLINDLKHQQDDVFQIQKIFNFSKMIQVKMDEILSSVTPIQFSRNVTESKNMVSELLEILDNTAILDIPNKVGIVDILEKLQGILNKIDSPKG